VSEQHLKTLKTHTCIEKLGGKGVSQRMETVSLMSESSFEKISEKHTPGGAVGQGVSISGIKKNCSVGISYPQSGTKGIHRIVTQIDHPADPILLGLKDENFALT
jgi:hypothetical protein